MFSDISLLKDVQQRARTKNNLRHLLTLFTRLAALTLLITAFAEPRIPNSHLATPARPVLAICIDNSLSMQNQREQNSLFALAKQRAFEIIEAYPQDVDVQILSNDLSAPQRRFYDRESAISMLDELETSPRRQSLERVLGFHDASLKEANHNASHFFFLSDFIEPLDSSQLNIDSSTTVNLVAFSGERYENVAIDSVWIEEPSIQSGQAVGVYYRVANHGQSLQVDVPVSINLGEQLLQTQLLSIEPGQTVDSVFNVVVNAKAPIAATISLEDQPIEYDNDYHFVLPVRSTYHVLEIRGGKLNSSPFDKLFNAEEFHHQVMIEDAIIQSEVDTVDLLILNQIEKWNTGILALVDQINDRGSNALVVLPDDLNSEAIELMNQGLGVKVSQFDTAIVPSRSINEGARLFNGIFEGPQVNVNLPSSSGHWSISHPYSTPLISLINGNALLSSFPNGQAEVFIIASPLKDKFTNFHRHALFVPAVINMCLFAGISPKLAYNVNNASIDLNAQLPELATMQHQVSGYSFIPRRTPRGVDVSGMIPSTGFYELQTNAGNNLYAFNLTRDESPLFSPNMDALVTYLRNQGVQVQTFDGNEVEISGEVQSASLGTSLWPWFMAFALLFIGIESILIKRNS